jgi:hypothetical protein
VIVSDNPASTRDNSSPQEFEPGCIEEVDVALFVIPGCETKMRQRTVDLMIWNRCLDFDCRSTLD